MKLSLLLSATLAALQLSTLSRLQRLRPVAPVNPHRSDVVCASFLLCLYRWCEIFHKTSTPSKPLELMVFLAFAKEMCLCLGTFLTAISNASLAAGELPQAFKQADITPVYKSEIGKQPATIDQSLSFPLWESFLRKLCQHKSSFPGQQQSSSWNPVCLPRQPLNWTELPLHLLWLAYCWRERLWKGNWLSFCRPEQDIW